MFKLVFTSITTSVLALKLDFKCEKGNSVEIEGWYSDKNVTAAKLKFDSICLDT